MDRSNIIYLVSQNRTQDSLGVWRAETVNRKVYCQVSSVSQSEWYEGGRNGLNPALRFRMFKYDYQGESVLIYEGKEYSIYRTFVDRNEIIELYTELRKGS